MSRETMEEEAIKKEELLGKMNELFLQSERMKAEFSEIKTDMETRIRVLETLDANEMRSIIHNLESRIKVMEMTGDDRKQNLNIAVNFVVQLLWVCMSAYLLTKLGLQPPL